MPSVAVSMSCFLKGRRDVYCDDGKDGIYAKHCKTVERTDLESGKPEFIGSQIIASLLAAVGL